MIVNKGVYDRLVREFASAAKVHVSEGSANRVYLHAIVSLSPNDFTVALRDYTLKTEKLDLFPSEPKDFVHDSLEYVIFFSSYIHWLRRKRMLERFFMGVAKDMDKLEEKKLERKFEESCINDTIAECKASGWDWLEKSESNEEKLNREGGGG
jgi:hypothetical protein